VLAGECRVALAGVPRRACRARALTLLREQSVSSSAGE
jgi:hypothetical protein